MPRTARRPAMTDPGELLLFVTEPQQLDAVFEYGVETLSVDSITVAPARERVERGRCLGGPSYARCATRCATGYAGASFCEAHDAEGQAYATRDRRPVCYRCSGRFEGSGSICPACVPGRDALRARVEASRAPVEAPAEVVVAVVPCSGAKLDEPAPAGDLYLGSFHKIARQAAEAVAPGSVRILSALHGLLPLDRVTAPYDVTVGDPGAVDPVTIAEQLAEAGVTRVVALTPNRYSQLLVEAGSIAGVTVETPLAGSRGIGEQRGRLARIRDGVAS